MIIVIVCYVALFIGIGVADYGKIKSFDDYVVAGKNQRFIFVYLSLMASMIGASATIGITDRVVQIGFPAFWWLGVGAVGLILQSVFLSKKIRELNANTLPDIAMKTVGQGGKNLLAVIIAISWVGVVAAQFVSIAKIISVFMAGTNAKSILITISIIVVLYTVVGGQLSVVKTDAVQSIIIAFGVIITFGYLFFGYDNGVNPQGKDIELLNKSFDGFALFELLLITGGTYFLGPDIISRNLISKDGKVAKKAALVSGISVALYGMIVTLVALWTVKNINELNGTNPLIYVMNNVLPKPIAGLLCLALISTLLSSADTCLINAASIIEYDLLKRDKVNEIRVIVGIIGAASLFIALFRTDIIALLTGAYSIYAPGVVFPLSTAIIAHNKRKVNKGLWFMAVILGGACGVASTYFSVDVKHLPLIGMGISLVFSVLSVVISRSEKVTYLPD